MFENIKEYLNKTYTAQPEEPDDNDFEEEFEPDDPKTYEHLYTVSNTKIEAVKRAMAGNPPIIVCTMQYVLQLLGLPS